MDYAFFLGMQYFLILVLGVPVATLLSTWIVANYIWHPFMEKCKKDVLSPIPYEHKYPFINDDLVKDCSGNVLGNALVLENTKFGYILMAYNDKIKSFEYWADENIQYRYLETVARKYVQCFRCEQLYVNRYEELCKKWKQIQEEKANEEKKEKKNTDVFAILKSAKKQTPFISDKANIFIKRGRIKECTYFKAPKTSTNKFNFCDWKKINS